MAVTTIGILDWTLGLVCRQVGSEYSDVFVSAGDLRIYFGDSLLVYPVFRLVVFVSST